MNSYLPDVLRIVVALSVLLPASIQDWRVRRADNRYWIAGGIVGFILLETELLAAVAPLFYHFFVMAIAWIYFDIFWNGEEIFGEEGINLKGATALRLFAYFLSVAIVIGGIYMFWGDMQFSVLLSVLAMILFIYLLYMFDVIKGGADAKALMMLSLLFPHYPAISSIAASLPLISPLTMGSFSAVITWEQIFLPFSFIIFMTAAIVSLFVPLAMFLFNLFRGDIKVPEAFFGYKMPLSEVEKHHVWLMERVVGGKIKVTLFPKEDDTEQIVILKEMGIKEVWVNPKIPLLIFVTLGLVISLIAGNIILLIV